MNIFDKVMIMFGIISICFGLILKTPDFKSSLIFKVIPFFSGTYIIFYVLVLNNIISIN